jgi:hypothetical protein
MERVLPPCRERTVKFSLPPIEGALTGETSGPSAHEVSLAMNAVTSALARGEITPGEAQTRVVDNFVRAIETTKKHGSGLNLLQILTAGNYEDDNSEGHSDGDDCAETGDSEKRAIMKKLMITIRSRRRAPGGPLRPGRTGPRAAWVPFQPTREVLLQICCRCSHRQQSTQFTIVGSRNRHRQTGVD